MPLRSEVTEPTEDAPRASVARAVRQSGVLKKQGRKISLLLPGASTGRRWPAMGPFCREVGLAAKVFVSQKLYVD